MEVGSVILAPGYDVYDAVRSEEYGLGRYANVVNALQFERILSASGPTMGHVERPSDHRPPRKIAFLQCVGSRDHNHPYCSGVCCMYATKEAIIAREHDRAIEPTIFFIDMRAYGKGFDAYFERARHEHGVRFQRSMISRVAEDPETKDLLISYVDDAGEVVEEAFDLVVLSVGMTPSATSSSLARRIDVELDPYGFARTGAFAPLQTSRPGIYACGVFQGPKDIPETVAQASGAAAAASEGLSDVRGTQGGGQGIPVPRRDVEGEAPRIGVFVCRCGSNIGGIVDVPGLAGYAAALGDVVYTDENLYTCSQDTQERSRKPSRSTGLTGLSWPRALPGRTSPSSRRPSGRRVSTLTSSRWPTSATNARGCT